LPVKAGRKAWGRIKMNFDVSDSEKEVLEYLWENPQGMRSRDILAYFNENKNKDWKKQTLNTFLLRLTEKGLVMIEKEDKKRIYRAAYNKAEYETKKAEKVLDTFYGGSVSKFVMALTGGERLDTKTAEEIRKLLDEQTGGKNF